MAAARALEAVTFDYWNTLAYEARGHLRGLRVGAWAALLTNAGFDVDGPPLEAAYDLAWEVYRGHWEANSQFLSADAAGVALGHLEERLGRRVPAELRDQLFGAFAEAVEGAELHLTDGIEECLRTLRRAGLRLAIVCDVGFTASSYLRRFLDRRGLLELFDAWAFSDEVGAYKPSAVIFEHALRGLGSPEPTRAAHVGDIRRTDVAGARGMGMLAVRYTGVSDDDDPDQPEADLVVSSHRELAALLGVSASEGGDARAS